MAGLKDAVLASSKASKWVRCQAWIVVVSEMLHTDGNVDISYQATP